MSIPSDHVTLFRDFRADRYIDTVTVRDLTDRGTFNRTTDAYDSPSTTVIYTGGALIRPGAGASSRGGFSGGSTSRGLEGEVLDEIVVQFPYDTTGLEVGYIITVDASVHEPDLVGEELVIQIVATDTYNTHRVARCNRSQGGGDRG